MFFGLTLVKLYKGVGNLAMKKIKPKLTLKIGIC